MVKICEGDLLHKVVHHQHRQLFLVCPSNETYITSKVLLPSEDGLVSVQLTFELRDEFLDALFVRRLAAVLLKHPLYEDASRNRFKLAILDARCLFELGAGLWIGGDQVWAGPDCGEVATDGARLEQLEAIVLLLDDREGAEGQ